MMNYEIDLRPPERLTKRRKIKPSTFLAFFFLVLLLILVSIYKLSEISYNNFLYQVDQLKTEITMLNSDAAPLILMKEEVLETNRKANLESELTAENEPFSLIVRQIRALSPSALLLTDIVVSRNGYLEIFGYSYDMQTVADYLQLLEKSALIDKCDLSIINMTENSKFSFMINGIINQGEHKYDNEN